MIGTPDAKDREACWERVYYPILEATVGRPYALYVHGNSDTTRAVRGVETIATGLKWKCLREPLSIVARTWKVRWLRSLLGR